MISHHKATKNTKLHKEIVSFANLFVHFVALWCRVSC